MMVGIILFCAARHPRTRPGGAKRSWCHYETGLSSPLARKTRLRVSYLSSAHDFYFTLMWWFFIALAACRFAVAEDARCPAPRVWPSQLDDVAFDEEEIERRYNNREDFIFYWYEPDPLLSTIDAKRIDLPPWSEACAKKYRDDPLLSGVDCEIKPDTLLRGLHAATRRAEPDLAHFDESFVWAPGELDRIMVATLRFSEATVPPSPELSVRSTSRSSPRPTLEKMLTSRSFHTLQSSALDKLRRRKRGECKGDTSGKSDWCRETVFPELYFGGLVEALEEHMANGDLVFPEGK